MKAAATAHARAPHLSHRQPVFRRWLLDFTGENQRVIFRAGLYLSCYDEEEAAHDLIAAHDPPSVSSRLNGSCPILAAFKEHVRHPAGAIPLS